MFLYVNVLVNLIATQVEVISWCLLFFFIEQLMFNFFCFRTGFRPTNNKRLIWLMRRGMRTGQSSVVSPENRTRYSPDTSLEWALCHWSPSNLVIDVYFFVDVTLLYILIAIISINCVLITTLIIVIQLCFGQLPNLFARCIWWN